MLPSCNELLLIVEFIILANLSNANFCISQFGEFSKDLSCLNIVSLPPNSILFIKLVITSAAAFSSRVLSIAELASFSF